METRYSRLDRLISKSCQIARGQVRVLLAQGAVRVNQAVIRHADYRVGPFDTVWLNDDCVQPGETPCYLMLHKPAGVVSATRDARHTTVLDLVRRSGWAHAADGLHLAGRLDATSTGLLILTNDGQFSRRLCQPEAAIAKRYRVQLARPVTPACVDAFAAGMVFAYEGITTRPATLVPLAGNAAEVVLQEGRYHQIRRMFARLGNRVTALHRFAVGPWTLPASLAPGELMAIDPASLDAARQPAHCDT